MMANKVSSVMVLKSQKSFLKMWSMKERDG